MITVELPTPHSAQRKVIEELDRFNVLACGRRWGKDTLIDMLIAPALLGGQKAAVLAPRDVDRDKMIERMKITLGPLLSEKIVKFDRRVSAFKCDAGEIRYYTVKNHASIRGSGLDWVVLNEAGELSLMMKLGKVWEEVMRSTLLDKRGRALICGTPRGITDFYTLYRRGVEGVPNWRAWNYSSYDNPHLDPAEIQAMIEQERMSKLAIEQEIYAKFIQAEGFVFGSLDQVCVLEERKPTGVQNACVFGVDIGGVEDYTAVSIMSVRTLPVRELALKRWRTPQVRITEGRLIELVKEWRPAAVMVEANAIGRYFYEELKYRLTALGIVVKDFYTTSSAKADLVQDMRHAMERSRLQLTDDEVGIAELASYGMKRTSTGKPSFSAPKGMHDDTVIARALAYRLASSYSPQSSEITVRASGFVLGENARAKSGLVYRVEEDAWKPNLRYALSLPR